MFLCNSFSIAFTKEIRYTHKYIENINKLLYSREDKEKFAKKLKDLYAAARHTINKSGIYFSTAAF